MNIKEAIATRRKWERENVELAEGYAKRKSYREAARAYDSAGHHRSIRRALEAEQAAK